jgi:arylsulfatase A-like enzyme
MLERETRCRVTPTLLLACVLLMQAGCGADAPPERLRNVVLVSLDTLSALHTSAYRYERPTSPNLDALAARGALFENAYTQQVWTLTAHISLMTGLNPQSHGTSEQRAATTGSPTLAEILRAEGFATAAFTGGGGYMKPRFGLGRGFEHYRLGRVDAEADLAPALRWLEQQAQRRARDPDHRFFLFAHFFDIHSDVGTPLPYDAPPPHGKRFLGEVLPEGERWQRTGDTQLLIDLEKGGDASELDREVLGALYDGGVLHTDQLGLGVLLAKLEALDLMDETLVVVTADHGEELLEHGKVSHQQPYEETARIPLVFFGPGIAAGQRHDSLVELVDVMPSVLGLLEMDVPARVQGRDLSGLLLGRDVSIEGDAHVDGVFGGLPTVKWRYPSSIVREIDGRRWSYVNTVKDREQGSGRTFHVRDAGELYLLDDDPGQQRDLRAQHPEIADELRRALLAWYARNDALARKLQSETGPATEGPLLDEQEIEQLRALGYSD